MKRKGEHPPASLYTRGMYRSTKRGDVSRCQVPAEVYTIHDYMDSALSQVADLCEKMSCEFTDYVGSVGVNNHMSQLLENCGVCWDWSHLAFNKPTATHIQAFSKVCEILKPFLQCTQFPTGAVFQHVDRSWPGQRKLAEQYMVLAKRVLAVMSSRPGASMPLLSEPPPADVLKFRSDLGVARGFTISPVVVLHLVEITIGHKVGRTYCQDLPSSLLCKRYQRLLQDKVSSLVSLFVGKLPDGSGGLHCLPAMAYNYSEVSASEVRPVSFQRRLRAKQKHVAVTRHDKCVHAGGMAVLWDKGVRWRRLVFVHKIVRIADSGAISAAVALHPWFSVGHGKSSSHVAWHASKVLLRCRVLFPSESPCERVGSFMRLLWEQRQNRMAPSYLADRTLLAQAGVKCCGDTRDEKLIREVANAYEKMAQRTVHLDGPASLSALVQSGADHFVAEPGEISVPEKVQDLYQAGWLARNHFFQGRALASKPTAAPTAMREAIHDAITPQGIIQKLPFELSSMRADNRGATKSVIHEKVVTWMQSAEGKQWTAQKRELFGASNNQSKGSDSEESQGNRPGSSKAASRKSKSQGNRPKQSKPASRKSKRQRAS